MGAGPLAPSTCGPGSCKSSAMDELHAGDVAGGETGDVDGGIKQEEMWVFDRLARKCLQEEEVARAGHLRTTSTQVQKVKDTNATRIGSTTTELSRRQSLTPPSESLAAPTVSDPRMRQSRRLGRLNARASR